MHGALQHHRIDSEPDRECTLRVEVDQQGPATVLGERRAQIDRAGRLADAALLVTHGDHPASPMGCQRWGYGKGRQRTSRGAHLAGSTRAVHDVGTVESPISRQRWIPDGHPPVRGAHLGLHRRGVGGHVKGPAPSGQPEDARSSILWRARRPPGTLADPCAESRSGPSGAYRYWRSRMKPGRSRRRGECPKSRTAAGPLRPETSPQPGYRGPPGQTMDRREATITQLLASPSAGPIRLVAYLPERRTQRTTESA